ncbi:MAG: TrkH family potassium uptake protein [Lachnospiraceae bacterium]|nr:TrkH family potassium uptake protein [Lachnospiraceae bacterium]
MNFKGVYRILGFVVGLEGVFFLLPALVGLIYKEYEGVLAYGVTAAVCVLLALFITKVLVKKDSVAKGFYGKEGFVATSLSWILMSLIGAVPFRVTGDIPNYLDAVFETVSGFTTTGASIVRDVEVMLHCNLFFRSFTHWLGGMGVLVFILAIMPMAGGSPLSLMKAESPGPTVSKLVPKAQKTAIILYELYIALTLLEFLLIVFDPSINVFQAICHTFGTAGTGGFGVLNDSVASFSDYVKIVTTVFMLLFGLNFSFYYLLIMKRFKEALHLEEIKWYMGIYFGAVILMIADLAIKGYGLGKNLIAVFFSCASVMTTTGYTVADFGEWPTFTHVIFFTLMFVGGCAGSTGGGFKVARILLLVKQVGRDVRKQIHPNRITTIKADGKAVSEEVLASTNRLFITYVIILALSTLLIALDGFDFQTTFAAVMSTYNNIGVGLADICVGDSFAMFSSTSKVVMIFDMLFGRLEIIPMLLLISPSTWKK